MNFSDPLSRPGTSVQCRVTRDKKRASRKKHFLEANRWGVFDEDVFVVAGFYVAASQKPLRCEDYEGVGTWA